MGGGKTWLNDLFSIIGARNGLFYGFFYVSLGMCIASENLKERNWTGWLIAGIALLALESSIGVLIFHVTSTVLWFTTPISVVALFMLAKSTNVKCSTLWIRRLSSMIYFSHYLWVLALKAIEIEEGIILFLGVMLATVAFSYVVVRLSEKFKPLEWLF